MGFPHQKVQENRSKGFKFLLHLLFLAASSFFLPRTFKIEKETEAWSPRLLVKQTPLSERSKLAGRGPSAARTGSAMTVSEAAAQQVTAFAAAPSPLAQRGRQTGHSCPLAESVCSE